MTTEEIMRTIQEISRLSEDDEVAHSMEDELWENVLKAISEGAPNAAELAAYALKTKNISFSRWCA